MRRIMSFKAIRFRRLLILQLGTRTPMRLRMKLILAFMIFIVSFATKSLQAVDLSPLMYTIEQPFSGLTRTYDLRAASILKGEGILGPYNVPPWQTEWLAQAPGYSIFLSGVYSSLGRNFFKVQLVQNAVNSLSPIFIFLIAGMVVSWRVGLVSGMLAALSHHLSHISNFILPDSLCALPVLAAVFLLMIVRRFRRYSYWFYGLAGAMIGLSAWLRPQAMSLGLFLFAMTAIISARRWAAVKRAALLALVSVIIIAPITIRTYMVYGEFVPINIGVGLNLWEGIADASGARFGAAAQDEEVAAQEAILYDDPRYSGSCYAPDGITRDRDRIRKGLRIIATHPVWYAGTTLTRMGEMLKYSAHAPLVYRISEARALQRTAAIKPEWSSLVPEDASAPVGESIFWMRPVIRALQRMTKETMQLFILIGAAVIFAASWRRGLILLMVPLYYLSLQSLMHVEFRYTLPMHYFLFVFSATVWVLIGASAWRGVRNAVNRFQPKTTSHAP